VAGFQAVVLEHVGMSKTGEWRKLMTCREQTVCQVLFKGDAIGTAFLVNRDLIMSNWHVFERGGLLAPLESYAARFDYRASDEQHIASIGNVIPIEAAGGYRD
jgi:hypothetical protein